MEKQNNATVTVGKRMPRTILTKISYSAGSTCNGSQLHIPTQTDG